MDLSCGVCTIADGSTPTVDDTPHRLASRRIQTQAVDQRLLSRRVVSVAGAVGARLRLNSIFSERDENALLTILLSETYWS
jgi:hypothetical protein